MEIRLLGPAVRIMVDGRTVDAGTLKERAILANLALEPGRVVPKRRLIDNVWGSTATASVRSSLYAYITRIRNRIRAAGAGVTLPSRSQGYSLEISHEAVDWHRMRQLRERACELVDAGNDRAAAVLLSQALELWEGDPLAEFEGAWTHGTRESMHHTWQIVLKLWAESNLRIGHYDDVVAHVSESAAQHPPNEKLAVLLMRALAGSGRHAAALDVHARLRERLADEWGTQPSDATQEVFQRILTGKGEGAERAAERPRQEEEGSALLEGAGDQPEDRAGAEQPPATASVPAPGPATGGAPVSVGPSPAASAPDAAPFSPTAHVVPIIDCLGRDIDDFAERSGELAAILDRARRRPDATTVIVISGLGGMGKTSLALRAAHLLRDEFATRLQIDLHGHTTGQTPLNPGQALHLLLRKLDVATERIPPEPEARAALLAGRLAGRRALLVLDDATRGLIAPLLPGTPGCVVLVTSRWTLAELDGVHHVSLTEPDPAGAAAMFAGMAGLAPDQAKDPDVQRIVAACERLPLGLRMAGARLRHHPTWTPAYLADRIARNGLAEMRSVDRGVADVFAMSVRALGSCARAAFLRVALHPAPEFSLPALAAALGDETPDAGPAESAADELLACHFIEEIAPGRYRMHALLREFASEQAAERMSAEERRTALVRMLDFYWSAADSADRVVCPERRRPREQPPAPRSPALFDTAADARRWFEVEYPAIDAAAECAREGEFRDDQEVRSYAVRLPLAISGLSESDGPWESTEHNFDACARLCREDGDDERAALASFGLGGVQRRLRRLDDARESVEEALVHWHREGDVAGEADARDRLGSIHFAAARNTAALREHGIAVELFGELRDRRGRAAALNHVGTCHARLGDLDAAERACTEAAALLRAKGDRRGEALALANVAGIFQGRGYHRDAYRLGAQALAVFEDIGDRLSTGSLANNLGEILAYQGRFEEADTHFRKARELLIRVGAEAEAVHALTGIGSAQLALGQWREAWHTLQEASQSAVQLSDPVIESQVMRACGDVLSACRRTAEARLHYRNARGLAANGASADDEALAHDRLGDLCAREGRRSEAAGHWRRALALAEPAGSQHATAISAKIEAMDCIVPFAAQEKRGSIAFGVS